MGALERLRLLFAGDEHLLRLNTAPVVESETSTESFKSAQASPTVPEDPGTLQPEQLSIKVEYESEYLDSPSSDSNTTDPVPHDGTFCPLMVIARFPYHYIRGNLMQPVASQFFDRGQFWDRHWDLYYIHVPPRLGTHHLLLVPATQVRKLFMEVNKALDCNITLPVDEGKGIMLRFRRDGFPQPAYLGQSNSRASKDQLDSQVPRLPDNQYCPAEMDEQVMAFEKMMEAACSATKSKSKSKSGKAKKQQLRAQREIELAEGIKRAQAHLGLCSLELFCNQPCEVDGNWDQKLAEDTQPLQVAVDRPAPYPFWKEPVFISVDVEANELCHEQVTEVGISTLDTRDLIGFPPGVQGGQWQSRIQSRHLRVREYGHIVNQRYLTGCPDKYQFGNSEWVLKKEVAGIVQACFFHPSFLEGPDQRRRPLILVGHNLTQDIEYLKALGVQAVIDSNNDQEGVADRIDTADFFRLIRGEAEPRSLGGVLGELGITGWYLHNAGNDARYTLEALLAMLVMSVLG